MEEDFIVCSDRPSYGQETYLGQEGFIQRTTLEQAQQYLASKQQSARDPSTVRLYRLVAV